jgi:DNA repair protein RadC
LATSVIIAHNHPSGNLSPSNADISLTKKIKEAGEIMNITLLDHLIVTKTSYCSFQDEGYM